MADDDAELVALIDNELDESRRTAILARLAADQWLRQRYEELRRTGAPLAACLETAHASSARSSPRRASR